MYYTYYIILRINTIQNNTGVPDPNAWRQYWRESRGLAGMADQAALMDVESAGEEELEVGASPLQVPLAQAMAVQKEARREGEPREGLGHLRATPR